MGLNLHRTSGEGLKTEKRELFAERGSDYLLA